MFGPDVPDGFWYREAFISPDEERVLVEAIAGISFDTFVMRGVAARRRVKFYGQTYDSRPTDPMPSFLRPLREKVASWAGVPPDAFAMALINEYPPGATIGWHRDAPPYGIIAGISLLSSCRMKLRPYVSPADRARPGPQAPRRTTHEIELAPRSGYRMEGLARSGFEHSIPPTPALRYSITFRTLRRGTAPF